METLGELDIHPWSWGDTELDTELTPEKSEVEGLHLDLTG